MPFFDEKRYKNVSETDTPFYNLQIKYKLTYRILIVYMI